MTMPPRYTEFGFPLANLPTEGHAVTSLDVVNTGEPLLSGTLAIVMALNVAFIRNVVTTNEGADALSLIEGHLETALHILKRWHDTEGINTFGKDIPPSCRKEPGMDTADFSHLPQPVRVALRHVLVAIEQAYPAPTPPPPAPVPAREGAARYPRSPIELAVLDALAAMPPHGASALDLTHKVPYPRPDISHVLQGLVMLGTIHRLGHGYYVFGPPVSEEERWRQLGLPPRPHAQGHARLPGPELPPSTRYAARIARIVAQDGSRETTASPTMGGQEESVQPLD